MVARLFALIIRGYRKFISPLFGTNKCRFHPTCSQYGLEALKIHGALYGFVLTIWRILRCQPFAKGGFDPVPPKKK